MAESKTKAEQTYTVITQKTDPHQEGPDGPLVVSTRTLTVGATSEADARKQVEASLTEDETVVTVVAPA